MPVTFTLVDTFTKLAVAKLPRLALPAEILPVKFAVLLASSKLTLRFGTTTLPLKFAVLPPNDEFTVRFGTTTLPLKFAVLPANSKFTVKLLVVILLATLTKLAVARFPRLALLNCELPITVNKFVAGSNVKFALAEKSSLLLN